MKLKSILTSLAVSAFAGLAHGQTVIELTGATAFRSAAITAINASFTAGGPFAVGFAETTSNGSTVAFNSSSMQIWRGTFPGIAGTTIVRTSWNGSVEGIRAVARPGTDPITNEDNDPLYLKESILGANGTTTGVRFHSDPNGGGAAVNAQNYVRAESDFSFSDVAQSATPVSGLPLTGGPVGVVVFTMVANKSWSDERIAGTPLGQRLPANITAQQFRSMARLGYGPASFFTANAADTNRVFLTGRNDGSGTRTSYLSETGVGAATPIRQYLGWDRSNASALPSIFLIPANGGFDFQGTPRPEYRSTVWGNNLDGNGGHVSSGDVRVDLSKTTNSTSVWAYVDLNEDGEAQQNEIEQQFAPSKLFMISWVTYNDARGARGTGLASARTAEILAYEGVRVDDLAGDNPPANMSANDIAKVANGRYTAWNFQQLYYVASRPGAAAVFNQLSTRLNDAAIIGTAGLPTGLMNVNRTVDGGVILPK